MSVTSRATPSEAVLERHTVTESRILVVDDDPAFGDATARVLRAAGFEVFSHPTTGWRSKTWRARGRSIC